VRNSGPANRNDIVLLLVLFLFAFSLRFYDFSYPDFKWFDETMHVPAAINYWNNGQFEPDLWEHPPLRHIILYGFLQFFGDNPYGWRMRNILFGSIAAVLTYLFALEISGSRRTALMAGLLLATDPLHIVLSRYTYEEIYGGAFFLAAIVLYLKHNQRSLWFVSSALFLGCALATKWYYVPCWFLVLFLALRENDNYRNVRTALFISSTYFFIPLSIFILSYYQWFGRGYSVTEFIEFIINAYHSLQKNRLSLYDPGFLFLSQSSAVEWFIRPIVIGQGTYLSADRGEFILFLNNLPIWILTIPSMIGLTITAVRRRCMTLALPALFFCASYMLYFIVQRPVFLYSAVPLLPFAFTAIAYGISQLADRYGSRLYYAALLVTLCWSLFLYPLVTAKQVPVAAYKYIINNPGVRIH
jgi:dolichyl-phosphate-mannose-protein mannosyltransferase